MAIYNIKKTVVLFILFLPLVTSCSSLTKIGGHQDQFHFLFEKSLQTRNVQDCMAVYYRGPFLYFFTSYYNNLYKITVYNPASGEFAELPVLTKGDVTCKSLPFKYQEPHRTMWIRVAVLQSPGFRQLFDNYKQDPDSLNRAIDAIPYLFRQGGMWNGELTAALTKKSFRASRLQDVVDYFL